MIIIHLCLAAFYVDNMGYQENILPKMHQHMGHHVEIITSSNCFDETGKWGYRPVGAYTNENGIKVTVLPFHKSNFRLSEKLHYVDGLYKKLDSISPDIIFCHGISFYSINELSKYCKGHKNVRLYCDCHSDYFNTPTNTLKYFLLNRIFWPIIAKKIHKYAIKFWGTTPARCDYLERIYRCPKDKIDLLVMGGDNDYISFLKRDEMRNMLMSQFKIPRDNILVVSGGKLTEGKNIIELIQAVREIKDMTLIIFGSLSRNIENDFYKELKSSKNIIYMGWKNQKDIYDIMISSDLAIFPGTHSVLWEQSIACGLPAVFRKRDLMTHVDIGGNCLFVESGTKEEIKSVLTRIKEKSIYNSMRLIAQTKGVEYFSYKNIAKRAIQI